MHLKKLEIQGFKSFAKKTVLEFEPGIISVVGPNGSGKSNFSDAIRWVLGEQSMKMMRSKKSEDVIFAGSDKKSKAGMAEVSITFDNADHQLPIDYTEVAITRRLYRDGESEYLINSQPVRLMDIVDMLAKSGYGNYSYHVISQGTIDQLIISGPSAIKNLIEEAVGVKPYYLKRERSARKLEQTSSNLLRVSDLVAEIEPRLRSLRRQAKRMEQRDQIVAELQALQAGHYGARYHDIARQLADADNRVAFFDRDLGQMEKELAQLTEQIKKLEAITVGKSKDYAKLQDDLRRQEKEKNRVQEELAMIRGQLAAGAPAGAADRHGLEARGRELEAKLKGFDETTASLRHQVVLGQKNLDHHQKIYASLDSEIENFTKQLEAAQNPFDLSKLKDDIEKIYSRYQSLLYTIRNLNTEDDFHILQEDAANLEIILVKLKDRFAQFSNLQLNHTELLQLNTQLQKIFAQKDRVREEMLKIQVDIDTSEKQRKFYEEARTETVAELERVKKELTRAAPVTIDVRMQQLAQEEADLQARLQQYFAAIVKLESDLKSFLSSETAEKRELLEVERQLRLKQDLLAKTKDERGLVLIDRARQEANLESLVAEIRQAIGNDGLEKIRSEAPLPLDPGAEQKIGKLKAQLELIGGVDELTMQEYRETEERFTHLTTQSADLQKAVDDLRQVIAELDLVIKKQFEGGFEKINEYFTEYFRILFGGGRATMTLLRERRPLAALGDEGASDEDDEDDEDEAAEQTAEAAAPDTGREEITGIDIRATPPGKKLALLSALSGGERTMTSIALLMAILTAFPSPFVVLDEVDAALDEANSIRLGKILTRLAHQTQFITITHNRETMRNSSMLYGITMGDDGISKVLSIKLEKAVEIAQ